MNELKNQTNFDLKKVIAEPYKYGFQTEIEKEEFPCGIDEKIVKKISETKNEPIFLMEFRTKAYKKWKTMNFPEWSNLKIGPIFYNEIVYYSIPKKKKN
jgi:Fe-S cluster assembly protein SufB